MKNNSQKNYRCEKPSIKELAGSLVMDEAEYEKEYKLAKFTDKELLEIFPEAKEIIPLKIKETKDDIQKKEKEIQLELKKLRSLKVKKFSIWFGREAIKMLLMPDLIKLDKRLLKLRRFQYLLNPKRNHRGWLEFGEKIEIARRYPIAELARDKLELRPSGVNYVALCPYHEERTPSFYLYTNTNSFVCFGCGEKGSIINLTMHLYDLEFKQAIEMLQN